jgi:hypothetical protein
VLGRKQISMMICNPDIEGGRVEAAVPVHLPAEASLVLGVAGKFI